LFLPNIEGGLAACGIVISASIYLHLLSASTLLKRQANGKWFIDAHESIMVLSEGKVRFPLNKKLA